jgi:hypothetical protein
VTTTANKTTTPCYAATSGEGYWTCDQLGGCTDCRSIARSAGDTDQLQAWKEDKQRAAGAVPCAQCGVLVQREGEDWAAAEDGRLFCQIKGQATTHTPVEA